MQIKMPWKPQIHKFMPMLDGNTAIEYLTVDFPWTGYQGHFLVSPYSTIHILPSNPRTRGDWQFA